MSYQNQFEQILGLILIALILGGCTASELTTTPSPIPPTSTPIPIPPTATFTPAPPTATPTSIPPTATPTPPPLVVGRWETTIAFNVGDAVNIVNFSFTVNEDGNQITGYGIFDLGLGLATGATTSAAIVDRTFTMNADSYAGTTKIGRTFEGTFVAPDKVEGTFVFDYGRGRLYEGEWAGAPEPEE